MILRRGEEPAQAEGAPIFGDSRNLFLELKTQRLGTRRPKIASLVPPTAELFSGVKKKLLRRR